MNKSPFQTANTEALKDGYADGTRLSFSAWAPNHWK